MINRSYSVRKPGQLTVQFSKLCRKNLLQNIAIFVLCVANNVMTTSNTMFSAVFGDVLSRFLEDIMRHILSHRLLNHGDPNTYTLTNTVAVLQENHSKSLCFFLHHFLKRRSESRKSLDDVNLRKKEIPQRARILRLNPRFTTIGGHFFSIAQKSLAHPPLRNPGSTADNADFKI